MSRRAARKALQTMSSAGVWTVCVLIVDTGQYNRGFLRNWLQFSTLGTHTVHTPAEDIV